MTWVCIFMAMNFKKAVSRAAMRNNEFTTTYTPKIINPAITKSKLQWQSYKIGAKWFTNLQLSVL